MSTVKQVYYTGGNKAGDFTKVVNGKVRDLKDDEILIKATAYAANPTDWKHTVLKWNRTNDVIVGSDVSGTIAKIGKGVSGFDVGDVVSATLRGGWSPEVGGFSEYAIVEPSGVIKYPKGQIDELKVLKAGEQYPPGPIDTFEAAAALTLSLGTVGCAAHGLNLLYDKEANSHKFILVWGGATSTGIYAVQVFSKIYGLKVIAVASQKNHAFLKSIGADYTFDYKSSLVLDDIRKVGGSNIPYVFDTVSEETTLQQSYEATSETQSVNINVLAPLSVDNIKNRDEKREVSVAQSLVYTINGKPTDLIVAQIYPYPGLIEYHHDFWTNHLPKIIKDIKTPGLRVLPSGLESANEALSLLYENKVSAEKIVFRN